MKKIFVFCIALNCLILQSAFAGKIPFSNSFPNDSLWGLHSVYSQIEINKQQILKLYKDNSYEFIVFRKTKSKTNERRSVGTYKRWKKYIIFKNEGKSISILPKLMIINSSELSEIKYPLVKRNFDALAFSKDTSTKYTKDTYLDDVFGKISNNKSLKKKILEDVNSIENKAQKEEAYKLYIDYYANYYAKTIQDLSKTLFVLTPAEFKKLKAVLVLGSGFEGNTYRIVELQFIATMLRNLGVEVHELYRKEDANWSNLIEVAENANILIYSGHGLDPNYFRNDEDHFALNKGESTEKKLNLANNALVIYKYTCYAAGTSTTEPTTLDIAYNRVVRYSDFYLKSDIGAYYATCENGAGFLISLFEGNSAEEAYLKDITNSNSTPRNIKLKKTYSDNPNYTIQLSSYMRNEKERTVEMFTEAFVGKANLKARDLLVNNDLQVANNTTMPGSNKKQNLKK